MKTSDLSDQVVHLFVPCRRERRFLVSDVLQLILVEPDTKRLGWGVVRFVGFLQVILI